MLGPCLAVCLLEVNVLLCWLNTHISDISRVCLVLGPYCNTKFVFINLQFLGPIRNINRPRSAETSGESTPSSTAPIAIHHIHSWSTISPIVCHCSKHCATLAYNCFPEADFPAPSIQHTNSRPYVFKKGTSYLQFEFVAWAFTCSFWNQPSGNQL